MSLRSNSVLLTQLLVQGSCSIGVTRTHPPAKGACVRRVGHSIDYDDHVGHSCSHHHHWSTGASTKSNVTTTVISQQPWALSIHSRTQRCHPATEPGGLQKRNAAQDNRHGCTYSLVCTAVISSSVAARGRTVCSLSAMPDTCNNEWSRLFVSTSSCAPTRTIMKLCENA